MNKRLFSIIVMAAAVGLGLYGCGETEPNPLASLDMTSSETGFSQDNVNTDVGANTNTEGGGQAIIAKALTPQTDISDSAVIAVSMGHDPASGNRHKGELSPQNHDPNENPHETQSISMVITDVNLVTAQLDASQSPQWDIVQDPITGEVTSASLRRAVGSSDVTLLAGGSARETIFGCGALTFPDPTLPSPSLDCTMNNILQTVTIPVQDAITRADQNARYNGVLVQYVKGSIDLVDNYLGYMSEDCVGKTLVPNDCTYATNIKLPIQLAPHVDPNASANSSMDDYLQADVGYFFLPITEPQIFANAVYKLRIDPFSQIGPGGSVAFNPGMGTDIWQIVLFGSVAFESLPPASEILLGTKTESGTVIQINNPFVAIGSTVDESGQNSALPNPDPSSYWFIAGAQGDQIGTVGQPILVCTTEDDPATPGIDESCTDAGVDSTTAVLRPDANPTFCNGFIISKIACQSRSVDGAFAGTPQTIIGDVVLLTTPSPDFSGMLGFGTLALRPVSTVHITEVAQAGAQPPQ